MKPIGKGKNTYLVVREATKYHWEDGSRRVHKRKADDFSTAANEEYYRGDGVVISITLQDSPKLQKKRREAWMKEKKQVADRQAKHSKALSKLTKAEQEILGIGKRRHHD